MQVSVRQIVSLQGAVGGERNTRRAAGAAALPRTAVARARVLSIVAVRVPDAAVCRKEGTLGLVGATECTALSLV